MDMATALLSLHGTYIEASLAFDEQRFSIVVYFFAGMSLVFGFWFNISDREKQRGLYKYLALFTIAATISSSALIYFYSKNYHTHFIYAEKMMGQIQGIVEQGGEFKREKLGAKFDEAEKFFVEKKRFGMIMLWVVPTITYGIALVVTGFVVVRHGQWPRSQKDSPQVT